MKAVKQKIKKKYKPNVLSAYKYRGYEVREVFNAKTKRREFKARFQFNNEEYTPAADSKKELEEIIDEIIHNARRQKQNLSVPVYVPLLSELFNRHCEKIKSPHQKKVFQRVSRVFLTLVSPGLKITELKKSHLQKYIDLRQTQIGVKTRRPILDETIDKELSTISGALTKVSDYYEDIEKFQKPNFPKAVTRKGPKRKRTKVVLKENELDILLNELRKPRTGNLNEYTVRCRRRLADDLEFRYETGLRKKETRLLKTRQYFKKDKALRNVIRYKTDTVTEFYPLNRRAIEIIEERIKLYGGEYIFTENGNERHADYRSLKTICARVGIPYGRYAEDGFVPHDLRRSFATNVIQYTDIETAREFLGHSNITQTGTYLKTNEQRMREAVMKSDKVDLKRELVQIYKDVRRGKTKVKQYLEKLKKIDVF